MPEDRTSKPSNSSASRRPRTMSGSSSMTRMRRRGAGRAASGDSGLLTSAALSSGAGVTSGATGRVTVKVDPRPAALSTSTRPPWASAMCLTRARPMPLPRTLRVRARVRAVEALEDALLLLGRDAGAVSRSPPAATPPGARREATATSPPSPAYLTALSTRLSSASVIAFSSMRTGGSRGSISVRRLQLLLVQAVAADVERALHHLVEVGPRRTRSRPCRARSARSRARCR